MTSPAASAIRATEARLRRGASSAPLVRGPQAFNAELERRVLARTAELREALEEREVLLREVHHRVKNNLQVISSLLNMQRRSLGEGAGRDALAECQTRVQAIALIHEQLHQSRDCAQVQFRDYALSLAANVFEAVGASPRMVLLKLDVEEVTLEADEAVPCGLILNELITNALKHAFPGGRAGTVSVELRQLDDGAVRLGVSDDGVGLPAGLDVQGHASLGLQLVRMLAQQLDARLDVVQARGTSFRLTVPARP
jgi:two-component sensor histidine kinase